MRFNVKSKCFTNVVTNLLLIVIVAAVFIVGFAGNTQMVYRNSDDSVVYKGTSKNSVSIMFNVYWGTEYLPQILEILEKYCANCTFFVGGCWVAKNPEILTLICSYGHEIGNHGYFHKEHSNLSIEQNISEIDTCSKLIWEYVAIQPKLFAPPSGDFGKETVEACKKIGYTMVMWSKDTIDWRDKESQLIYTRATNGITAGDLILMHPTKQTVDALPKILEYYNSKGLSVVSVTDNIGETCNISNNTKVG